MVLHHLRIEVNSQVMQKVNLINQLSGTRRTQMPYHKIWRWGRADNQLHHDKSQLRVRTGQALLVKVEVELTF